MDSLTRQQKAFFIKSYYTRSESISEACRAFRTAHKNSKLPSDQTLRNFMKRFEEEGVFEDNRSISENIGRPATVITEENIKRVEEFFKRNPRESLRKASYRMDINLTSLHTILKHVLGMKAYKITTTHRLTEHACTVRKTFCAQFLGIEAGETFPGNLTVFTDEAHFWGDGYVNRQNCRFWGTENPHLSIERSLHPWRVTVWAAFTEKGIFVDVFENSVTGETYEKLLREKWFPFARRENAVQPYYFMQDGAPPHRTMAVFNLLEENYNNRVVAYGYPEKKGKGLIWPPYSPDLNPCDYFLWGYLKDTVYREGPIEKAQLIASIYAAVNSIKKDTRKAVIDNFYQRVQCCYMEEGRNFEHILR